MRNITVPPLRSHATLLPLRSGQQAAIATDGMAHRATRKACHTTLWHWTRPVCQGPVPAAVQALAAWANRSHSRIPPLPQRIVCRASVGPLWGFVINVLDIVQATKADHLQAVRFQVRFAFEARILSVRSPQSDFVYPGAPVPVTRRQKP